MHRLSLCEPDGTFVRPEGMPVYVPGGTEVTPLLKDMAHRAIR
ncbi:MAG: hypothetical protein ABSC76_17780 [Terracidiphilus sp.]|jgi:hypothetical protein